MSVLSAANPTILDIANRLLPNGSLDHQIVEMMHQQNEVWLDACVIEANDGSGHKSTIRAGIPEGTWREMYQGVPEKKTTTAQIRDAAGMLENYSKIDKAQADLNGGSAEWRLTEEAGFIEGMNQQAAATIFNGDTRQNPARFMGLAPRFNHSTAAESGENIIKGGATSGSNNATIWIVDWHPTICTLFYPKGSKAGLSARDLGEQTVLDENGNPFQAYRTHYKHDLGLAVRDWRHIVRIPNIDVTALTKDAATGADLYDLIAQGLELMPPQGVARRAIYCNKTIRSFMRRQARYGKNVNITVDQVAGKPVVSVDEVPVRRVDQLTNTEAIVP